MTRAPAGVAQETVASPTSATTWMWFDGRLVPRGEVHIDPLAHALHYGTGVFEGIRCYTTAEGPALFRLEEHLQRFAAGAGLLGMTLPSMEELANACRAVVAGNGLASAYVRPLAFYGAGGMGFRLADNPTHVLVAAWEWGAYMGEQGLRDGIALRTSTWRKISTNALPSNLKVAGAYANSVLAFREAVAAGADEALLLNERGDVAEGSGENVFAVRGRRVVTPPPSDMNLPGITRDAVLTLAADLGYEVEEATLTRPELLAADEVFLTGTAAEVTPVREIDRRPIGSGPPGPVTRRLQATFLRAAHGEEPGYRRWLSWVRRDPTALDGGV